MRKLHTENLHTMLTMFPIEVIVHHADICAEAKEEFRDPFSPAEDSPNETGIHAFNFVNYVTVGSFWSIKVS